MPLTFSDRFFLVSSSVKSTPACGSLFFSLSVLRGEKPFPCPINFCSHLDDFLDFQASEATLNHVLAVLNTSK